ncbi:GTT2 [Symbiodinium microadriaticum]|nr:GTT2 [Symbiodinium microadriaticum]
MKLYNSQGPNPHIVRMFAAEKGIDLALEEVDLMGGANRQEPYLKINPAGQLPALALDNGDVITEVTAICEYLDEVGPGDSLIGSTPEERAQTRRWTRNVDLNIAEPMLDGFRCAEGFALFEKRMRLIPEAAEGQKARAQDKLKWLDEQLEGKDYLTGAAVTLADIFLFCILAFGSAVGQPLNPDFANVKAWFDRMAERPSAAA